jgi:hypothetical protein
MRSGAERWLAHVPAVPHTRGFGRLLLTAVAALSFRSNPNGWARCHHGRSPYCGQLGLHLCRLLRRHRCNMYLIESQHGRYHFAHTYRPVSYLWEVSRLALSRTSPQTIRSPYRRYGSKNQTDLHSTPSTKRNEPRSIYAATSSRCGGWPLRDLNGTGRNATIRATSD